MAANNASTASPIVLIVLMLSVSLNEDSYSSARYGRRDPHRAKRLSIVALKPLGLVLAFGAMHLSQWVSVDPLRVIDKKAHGENISTAGTRDRDGRPLKRVARHEGRANSRAES